MSFCVLIEDILGQFQVILNKVSRNLEKFDKKLKICWKTKFHVLTGALKSTFEQIKRFLLKFFLIPVQKNEKLKMC